MLLRTRHEDTDVTVSKGKLHFVFETVILLSSLALLLVGGDLVSEGAQDISLLLALSLSIVGVVVGVGTCLPELSFALRAAKKNHCEIDLGNILGNVLADCLMAIGIIALIQPIKPVYPIFPCQLDCLWCFQHL